MIDFSKLKTAEQKKAEADAATISALTGAIQSHLDAKAKERNYDGILSLCSYATSTNPKFATEGQAGVVWRDSVWAACYSIMSEVTSGARSVPTAEELIAEMPTFVWPSI